MDKCIDSLGDTKTFSTLDANSGYGHIEVHKGDRQMTALALNKEFYQFTRMPLELRRASATFNFVKVVRQSKVKRQHVFVYLDYIFMFSKTPQEPIKHTEMV